MAKNNLDMELTIKFDNSQQEQLFDCLRIAYDKNIIMKDVLNKIYEIIKPIIDNDKENIMPKHPTKKKPTKKTRKPKKGK